MTPPETAVRIAPSILSADFGRLAEEIAAVEEAGADLLHIDVMDGHFVPNITIGPLIVEAARRATDLPLDVHLMIESPERYLAAFAGAGAHWITVHQEVCSHLHRMVEAIRNLGVKPGVAVNPATPVDTLRDVAEALDLLLIMSVNPGFGGQAYIEGSTAKIARARELLKATGNEGADLEVDGGINRDTAAQAAGAGATILVAGSAVFKHPQGVVPALRSLRKAVSGS